MKIDQKRSVIWLSVFVAFIGLTACGSDDGQQVFNPDTGNIAMAIDSASILYNSAEEGSKPGDYAVGSKTELKKAIDLASATKSSDQYDQREVDNALASLYRAVEIFKTRLIQEVSVENLIAQWKFEGNTDDVSGNGHNGMLMSGIIGPGSAPMDGNTKPVLVADRFDRPDNAYDFENGAYVEVPYTVELNPKEFTISLWVKRHGTNPDNYMFSLNTYNGFKFQLQGSDFLFLTIHADNGYHDVDSAPGVVPDEMKFYINDKLVKTEAVTGIPITLESPVDLAIGQQLPKGIINFSDTSNPFYYYGQAFFVGAMDDIRFYNRALSDAEVLSIYTIEQSL